jgi:hypothetical protein
MTLLPACLARMALRAASITRSAFFTLDPPNFCTTTPTAGSLDVETTNWMRLSY